MRPCRQAFRAVSACRRRFCRPSRRTGPPRAEEQPPLLPTRDVDITYNVTRPHARPISERVRWSAAAHLERIDGPNRSTSIFDRQAHEVTLLNGATRTYTKLDGYAAPAVGARQGCRAQARR